MSHPLTRIVRMQFRPEAVAEFLAHFETVKQAIRNQPGCQHLALHRDAADPAVYYTYSLWTGTEALDTYRHSELFKTTWAFTKARFAGPPMAFSLERQQVVA